MKMNEIITSRTTAIFVALAIVLSGVVSCRRVSDSGRNEEPKRKVIRKVERSRPLSGPHQVGPWSAIEQDKFGRLLQEYLGTPYQGTSKYQAGIDCSRFTSEVYRRFDDLRLPRVARDQARSGQSVSRSHLRYGDLVFFAIGGKTVSHVGIYIGDESFIHASSSRGVVIDKLGSSYWRKYYHSARRVVFLQESKSTRSKSKSH
jgi:NlpC/P60 family